MVENRSSPLRSGIPFSSDTLRSRVTESFCLSRKRRLWDVPLSFDTFKTNEGVPFTPVPLSEGSRISLACLPKRIRPE